MAVVDAGPLYAAIDTDDEEHRRSREALETPGLRQVVPTMVVAEVSHFVGRRLGPAAEAAFLTGLIAVDVDARAPEDWARIAELVRTYDSVPPGGTDAAVIVAAERLQTDLLITLDRRHFAAVRPRHVANFRLLPE